MVRHGEPHFDHVKGLSTCGGRTFVLLKHLVAADELPDHFIAHALHSAGEINGDPASRCTACWSARTTRRWLVNITDIEPAEKPEAVYWVDPIHKQPDWVDQTCSSGRFHLHSFVLML